MVGPVASLRALTREERVKAGLLSGWFFVVIATLWLLKPIRSASLLAHLGAAELPHVRLASVVAVAVVALAYSRVVGHLRRVDVARGASLLFAAIVLLFWIALQVGGAALGAQRWFVWSVFVLVDAYATVMVSIFWTYTNDVMSPAEADRLYGPIGIGGIVGGIAGGVFVDGLVHALGAVDLLLVCAALGVACALLVGFVERTLAPPPRARHQGHAAVGDALGGARQVLASSYLQLIVGVVIAYEFAAAMTDFVVNVVFDRAFASEVELAQMFGRLGWIVSATALVAQLVIVPSLLPAKRIALLVPPIAMAAATFGLALAPVVPMAVLMSAADRGLNYSLQQATKETLYVPLTDAQRYEGKAFIDMFVDRLGKALSALSLMLAVAAAGMSIPVFVAIALVALAVWLLCAIALGRANRRRVPAAQRELAGRLA